MKIKLIGKIVLESFAIRLDLCLISCKGISAKSAHGNGVFLSSAERCAITRQSNFDMSQSVHKICKQTFLLLTGVAFLGFPWFNSSPRTVANEQWLPSQVTRLDGLQRIFKWRAMMLNYSHTYRPVI